MLCCIQTQHQNLWLISFGILPNEKASLSDVCGVEVAFFCCFLVEFCCSHALVVRKIYNKYIFLLRHTEHTPSHPFVINICPARYEHGFHSVEYILLHWIRGKKGSKTKLGGDVQWKEFIIILLWKYLLKEF